jgi:hypothetical protein
MTRSEVLAARVVRVALSILRAAVPRRRDYATTELLAMRQARRRLDEYAADPGREYPRVPTTKPRKRPRLKRATWSEDGARVYAALYGRDPRKDVTKCGTI